MARSARRSAHRVLVDEVAAILASGKPTYFQFYAACRHGLRAGRCAEGTPWDRADEWARDVISQALRKIGGRFPTWEQGQREYTGTEDRMYCANPKCGKVIVRDPDEYRRVIYCSVYCRHATQNLRYAQDHREEAKARSAAWRAKKDAEAPVRNCETCGKPFRKHHPASRPPPRFCSRSCQATHFNKQPSHPWRAQKNAHAAVRRVREEKACELCGTRFYPKHDQQRFCGRGCSQRANSHARWKPNGHCKRNGSGASCAHRPGATNTQPARLVTPQELPPRNDQFPK